MSSQKGDCISGPQMGNIIVEEIRKKVVEGSAKLLVADETLEITENEADCESSQDGDCISGPQFVHSIIKEIVEMEESTKQSTGGKQPQMVEAVVAPVVDMTMKVSHKKKQQVKHKAEQETQQEIKQEVKQEVKQESKQAAKNNNCDHRRYTNNVSVKKEAILPSPAQGKSDGFVSSGSRPGSDKSIGVNTKNKCN